MIYSTNRKNYISGDYLYDKQINDNISLLTVQIIWGYSSLFFIEIYIYGGQLIPMHIMENLNFTRNNSFYDS